MFSHGAVRLDHHGTILANLALVATSTPYNNIDICFFVKICFEIALFTL